VDGESLPARKPLAGAQAVKENGGSPGIDGMTVDDLTGYLKQHWLEHVSKMPPECDPEAGEVKEGVVNGEQMLVTNQQSAKLPEPCIGSFHDPSALVAAELAAIS